MQDAQKYHEQALFVKDVHMSVLTDFKEIEISAVNEISVLNVTASSLDDKVILLFHSFIIIVATNIIIIIIKEE